MRFNQPNNLARVMSQILDRLSSDRALTMEFANHDQALRAREVLLEVANLRQIGVEVIPNGEQRLELQLADLG